MNGELERAEAHVDLLFWNLLTEVDPIKRRGLGNAFTAAVKARNALRNAEQISAIERERGLL